MVTATRSRHYGGNIRLGVAWFRRIKTYLAWGWEDVSHLDTLANEEFPIETGGLPLEQSFNDVQVGWAGAGISFDFRSREHALMSGNALSFGLRHAAPAWGSSPEMRYWKASLSYNLGVRIFKRHNWFIKASARTGRNMPVWDEYRAGGPNLRGHINQQFRGDSMVDFRTEYHFPLFSISSLDFRALTFFDSAALWYRELPEQVDGAYERRSNGRLMLPPDRLVQGFDITRDINAGVGGGLRFYLRSVAVPLVGLDYGYSLRDGVWRMVWSSAPKNNRRRWCLRMSVGRGPRDRRLGFGRRANGRRPPSATISTGAGQRARFDFVRLLRRPVSV